MLLFSEHPVSLAVLRKVENLSDQESIHERLVNTSAAPSVSATDNGSGISPDDFLFDL